jgi:hypothetical protein
MEIDMRKNPAANTLTGTTYAAMLLALSGGIIATASFPVQALAQTSVSISVGEAPPPPRFESVPAPRRGYIWAPGYWNWDGHRHEWQAGHWEQERPGAQYRRPEWMREGREWRLNRGGWIDGRIEQPRYEQVRYDYVEVAPPPPRSERVHRSRPGYIWSPGHWEWRGHRHQWVPGVWLADRPGYLYNPPVWVQRDGRWYMEQGRWIPRGPGRGGRGDSDRDGIPNRYDHDRDNDGVPNRRDRDRDGDGVPNRHDAQPDNPRRD